MNGRLGSIQIASLHMLAALTITTLAAAQDKTTPAEHFRAKREQLTEEVQVQLKSEDPATIAWGAHTAAEFRLRGCIPELRAQLRAKELANEFVALALLDALIQANASLPDEELRPFVKGITTNSVLVLILPQAKHNLPLLLEAYRACHRGGQSYLRCGQELADAKAPGFALELLREPVWVVLTVWDPGNAASAPACGLGYTSCIKLMPPPGYPPCMQYGLEAGSRFGSEWLVDAGTDLASTEQVTARTTWMKRLLGTQAEFIQFDLMPIHNVEWVGLDALRAREQEERTRILAMHQALVLECVKAKLVTAEEVRGLVPQLRVFWNDMRAGNHESIDNFFGH